MTKPVPVLLALLIGIVAGWTLGYTQPLAKAQREFANNTNMTPEEIRALMQRAKEIFASMEEDNSGTAIFALYTLIKLQEGESAAVKAKAIETLARFYHNYGPPDESKSDQPDIQRKLLRRIAQAGQDIPELNAAIENGANGTAKKDEVHAGTSDQSTEIQ